MVAYYNENDLFAAAWLRELVKANLIAPGDVDERDIRDVKPDELRSYTQCHFFAGIGGWSYALRLAGWPDDRPVWTGSCPCQPFSAAGKREGTADERHLWPAFFHLIHHAKPTDVPLFGEQVEAAIGHGWLDLVQDDMEGIDHAVWPVAFPACGVGAPHRRQRLYFVAHPECAAAKQGRTAIKSRKSASATITGSPVESGRRGDISDESVDNSSSSRRNPALKGAEDQARDETRVRGFECGRTNDRMAESQYSERRAIMQHRQDGCDRENAGRSETHSQFGTCGEIQYHDNSLAHEGFVGNSNESGSQGRGVSGTIGNGNSSYKQSPWSASLDNPWSNLLWLPCRDGKLRPTEPAIFPLANGLPRYFSRMQPELRRRAEMAGLSATSLKRAKGNRIGALRGAGNAIVPQQAAAFISAYLETVENLS